MAGASAVRSQDPAHRVVLVREWDEQHTGSGCCGRLGGTSELAGAADFAGTRCTMEQMGGVYRALREALPRTDVDLQVVDPRNTAWLVPVVWRDARRSGCSRREAWRNVCRATSPAAVVCDGRVLFWGEAPNETAAVDAVLTALSDADRR